MNNLGMRFYIIALNIAFFLIFYLGSQMGFSILPKEHLVLGAHSLNHPLSIFNNNFMHGGFLHLLMNMVFVYFFGNIIDSYYNKKEQIFLYFGTGIAIALVMIGYIVTLNPTMTVVGYSGVAFALLGAAYPYLDQMQQKSILIQLVLFHVLIIMLKMPISWESHLLGAIIGFLYANNRFLNNRNRPKPQKKPKAKRPNNIKVVK